MNTAVVIWTINALLVVILVLLMIFPPAHKLSDSERDTVYSPERSVTHGKDPLDRPVSHPEREEAHQGHATWSRPPVLHAVRRASSKHVS